MLKGCVQNRTSCSPLRGGACVRTGGGVGVTGTKGGDRGGEWFFSTVPEGLGDRDASGGNSPDQAFSLVR